MSCLIRPRTLFGAALCTLVLAAGTSFGQGTRQTTTTTETRTTTSGGVEVHRITHVIGDTVVLQDRTQVGKIEDIVLGEGGCIDYVVVSYHDKVVFVPWTAARVDFSQRVVNLNVTREKFEQVPSFAADRWPNFSDRQFSQRIDTVFGVTGNRRVEDRRPMPNDRRYGSQGEQDRRYIPNEKDQDLKRDRDEDRNLDQNRNFDRNRGTTPDHDRGQPLDKRSPGAGQPNRDRNQLPPPSPAGNRPPDDRRPPQ